MAGPAFDDNERRQQHGRRGQPWEHDRGRATHRHQQAGDAAEQQRGAEPVHFRLGGARARWIRDGDHRCRQDTERQIQVEHPAPRQRVGDIAAHERAGNRRDAPDAAEQRLGACALFERVQFADDRHAERDDGAGTHSLDRAKHDQLRHRCRGAGEGGSRDEDGDAGEIQPAAAVQIGQPPPDRHRRCRRQQVRGEHPAVVREAAEGGDDGRHRGPDHGGLERAEAHPEQQARRDRPAAAPADGQRRRHVRHLSRVPRTLTPAGARTG